MTMLIILAQTLAEVTLEAFAERPIMWTAFCVWVLAMMFSAGAFLEHRGWRGTAWATLSASAFAIVVAIV